MVDYVSLQRLRPNGYTAPEVRSPRRKVIRQVSHDCRHDAAKEPTPTKKQISAIFEVTSVQSDLLKFHEKTVFIGSADKEPRRKIGFDNKLIYSRGGTGSKPAQLFYPRGLAVSPTTCDIYVADTGNKRVQVYGSPGLLKELYERDANDQRFETPVSVAVSPSGRVAVADAGRNVICSVVWENRNTINVPVPVKPVCVQFHGDRLLMVGCVDGTVRQYDSVTREEIGCLQVLQPSDDAFSNCGIATMSIALDRDGVLYVVDGQRPVVDAFDATGRVVRSINVSMPDTRLGCAPSGITISSSNTLIVADALNHTVYSFLLPDGEFERCLLKPTDDLGAVHAVVETPEGHLVGVEYTINGPHGLKIFRYLKCVCHNPQEEFEDQAKKDAQNVDSKK